VVFREVDVAEVREVLRGWSDGVGLPTVAARDVQISLGALWLLDAALQLQPFMFTADFARQVLAPSGQDQPTWIAPPPTSSPA
jgi:hypothetical protein